MGTGGAKPSQLMQTRLDFKINLICSRGKILLRVLQGLREPDLCADNTYNFTLLNYQYLPRFYHGDNWVTTDLVAGIFTNVLDLYANVIHKCR